MKRILWFLLLSTMAAQTTPNLHLNLPDTSAPSWGSQINNNFTLLDTRLGPAGANQTVYVTPNNAQNWPGSDVGAQINSAIATLPLSATNHCGSVNVAVGNYSFSTSIVKPRCVTIDFNGATLKYTGSEQAIKVYDTYRLNTPSYYNIGGLEDVNLIGPSNSSGSSVGIYLGGDPAGVISPRNAQCHAQAFYNVHVHNFVRGWQFGRGAYIMQFVAGNYSENGTAVFFPRDIEYVESVAFISPVMNNNRFMGIENDSGAEITILGGSIDYNGQAAGASGPAIGGISANSTGLIHIYGTHFEQSSGELINIGSGSSSTSVMIESAALVLRKGATALVQIGGTKSALTMRDVTGGGNSPVAEYVNWQATGGQLVIDNMIWSSSIPAPALMNSPTHPPTKNISNQGTLRAETYGTISNCQLGGAGGTASPAACRSATAGVIAIPASQTSYTVDTTAVTANSEIFIEQVIDNSGLPSSPACSSTATNPMQSARSAGASFTFALGSTANVTCYKYWIVN